MVDLRVAFGRGLIRAGKTNRCVSQVRVLLHDLIPKLRASFILPVRVICYSLLSLMLSGVPVVSYAETIPGTLHWGWMKGWGAPWGAQRCGSNYSFEAANEFGCAPIADACHPNAGMAGYSPFVGIAGCGILNADGRLAGGGGSWYTCPDASWTLSGATCSRLDNTCPVAPLKPLDPALQPYEDGLIDMANETQATRDGAACIVRVARARRLSPRITSGYRPPAYQTHIREVYDQWQLLKNNNDAACADTKRKVEIEFDHHDFAHQPGNTSRHESGRAVDIHLSDYTVADTIAAGCNMSRPVPNDRVHFESPR